MTDSFAVMLCGHGSRSLAAAEEFQNLAGRLRERLVGVDVESGFLEFARPTIRDGLEALKSRGARRILCLPGMLFAAGHVKNDLPWEVNSFAAANPGIHVQFGRELAVDAKLLRAASECIAEAEARSDRRVDRSRTLLLVVGRGTNDSDANSNVSKVARMLWEGMGFGWCEVSYSGVAHPLVDVGLRHALRLGYERIIVFPYFLFTGILVQRIYDRADEAAAGNAHVEVLKAPYLNDHPLVVATLVDRLDETLRGSGVMNCQLCKYREQIIGYDQEVGAPQAGHHHHVRGIGTDAGHHHGHVHHSHAHGHQRSRSGHHEHPHDRRTSGGAALQDEHS